MIQFLLRRQDDNGNQFLVDSFNSLPEAEFKKAELSRGGHKQLYWIEKTEKEMKILKIEIVLSDNGPDTLLLTTNLPEPMHPFRDTGAVIKISAAKGHGEVYVKTNFPEVPYEVLNDRRAE